MPQRILMNMIHVTLYVPVDLDPSARLKVRRSLNGKSFHRGLRRQVRTLLQRFPSLCQVTFIVSR